MRDTKNKTGYKHTALGLIPIEWNWMPLGKLGKIGSGSTPPTSINKFWQNGNIPWVPTGKVNDRIIKDSQTPITSIALMELSISLLPINTILIAMIGQGQTRGKVALLKVNAWINQNFAYLITNENVTPEYLFQYLEANYERIRGEGNRGGNQGSLNTDIVKGIMALIPLKKEQIVISTILDYWDYTINIFTKIIQNLQLRNNGLVQNLLKPKLNWNEYRIAELLQEIKRPVVWDDDEIYHLISVRRRSGGAFFRESLYGNQILTKQLFTAEENDFLISKMQIVHGASAVVPKALAGMKISGSYIAVQSKDEKKLNINFFNWLSKTSSFYRLTYISSYGVHIEKMTFDFGDFKRHKIMLPTIEEQVRIVIILQTAADEIKIYEQQLAFLLQQKKGLMQKLLTGEVRVKI